MVADCRVCGYIVNTLWCDVIKTRQGMKVLCFLFIFYAAPFGKRQRVISRELKDRLQIGKGKNIMTIEETVTKYSPMLYRICVVMLGNETDAQDAVQDTICRYLERTKEFQDQEHEKAWLIRVARNRCIDMRRFHIRHPQVELSEVTASYENPEYSEVLTQLVSLPMPVKAVVYLYYIEGYKIKEVSEILGVSVNAVKKRLQRGRKLLRLQLGED